MAFPGFGASTSTATPAFGGGGFGGAASPQTPLFGQAAAAGVSTSTFGNFGAARPPASPTPFSFGGASASAFGAASTPSMFGASSTPASSTFSFGQGGGGTNLFAQRPATTPNLFSQPQASAASPFGATPGQQPFGMAGAFGTASTPAAAQPTMFGAAPAQGQMTVYGQGLPPQPDLAAVRELDALKDAYVPTQSAAHKFRFTYLFLNVVDNDAQRVKPPGVDELAWREALSRAGGPRNPDRLWPVLAVGFKDLIARQQVQDAAIREHSERLAAVVGQARQLARKQETLVRDRLDALRRKHVSLSHDMLRVMRAVDALEGRFAAAVGFWSPASKATAADLEQRLGQLEAAIDPSAPGGLQRRVEAIASAARLRAGAPSAGGLAGLEGRIAPDSLAELFTLLQQHAEALARLQEVMRRNNRDMAIMAEERYRSERETPTAMAAS